MRKPISISDLHYVWGDIPFYGIMTIVAVVLLLLGFFNESTLLVISGASSQAVASFGDFKGTDKITHFIQAGAVFIPLLLFSGWEFLAYGIVASVLTFLIFRKNEQKVLWVELVAILIAIVGLYLKLN